MSVIVTTKIFIEKAREKHNNRFDYSKVDYVSQKEKIIIICPVHGEILIEPRNHLRNNSGCNKCNDNIKKTNEIFIKQARLIHNNKYNYSKINYVNKYSILKIICPVHDEFEQQARFHLTGHGCQKCGWEKIGAPKRHTTNQFTDKAKKIHGNKYDYSLVNYTNAVDKIEIICNKHGIFKQTPYSHLRGNGCKKCNESKGENIIREFLEKNSIKYTPQHKFLNCKYKNNLLFDFYLHDDNICIEYNGAQHYKPVKYWGGEKTLKKIKIRDKIKMEYCKNNNIPLIIIRYNENILKKLNKLINPKT